MVDARDFMKAFAHGIQLVPVGDSALAGANPFALHGVTMNVDGSLQVDLGGREWRVVVKTTSPAKWMVDVDGVGPAALRPLTEEQHKRFFPHGDSGGSNAVSGETEQPG